MRVPTFQICSTVYGKSFSVKRALLIKGHAYGTAPLRLYARVEARLGKTMLIAGLGHSLESKSRLVIGRKT